MPKPSLKPFEILEHYETYARIGGSSAFEQKLQWLFQRPSVRLLKRVDRGTNPEDDLSFYIGFELSDPITGKSLQIMGTNDTDLSMTLTIKD